MGEVARLNMDFVDEREIEALKPYLPEVKKMIQVLMSHHTKNEKVYVPAIGKLRFARDALETLTQRKLRSEMVDVEKTLINASKLFPILRFIQLPPVVFPENMNNEGQVSSTPRDSRVLRTLDSLNSKSSDIVNSSDRGGERLTETRESGNQIISNISASDQHERRLAETSGLPVNRELKSLSIPRKRKSDPLINQEFAQQNVSEEYKKISLNATQFNSLKDTPSGSNTNIITLSSKDFENIRDALTFLKRTDNTNNEQNSHPLNYQGYSESHLVSRVSESENHEQILQSPEYDSSSRSEQILQSPEYDSSSRSEQILQSPEDDSSSKSSSHKSCTLDVLEKCRQRLKSLNNQSTVCIKVLKSVLENNKKRSKSLNYNHKRRSGSRSPVHKSRMLSASCLKVMDWLQNTSNYNVLHSSERNSREKKKQDRVRLRNKSRNYSTKMKEGSMASSDFSDLAFNEECETECVRKNKQQFRTVDRDKSKFRNPVSTINNAYLPEFHLIRNLNEQSVEHVENIECGNDSVDTEAEKDETDCCEIVSDYIEKEIAYEAMTEIAYKAMIEKRKAMQYAARNKIFDTKNLTMENKIKNQSSDEFEIIGQKRKYIFDRAGGKLKGIKCNDLQYSNSMSEKEIQLASVTGEQNSDILKPSTSRTIANKDTHNVKTLLHSGYNAKSVIQEVCCATKEINVGKLKTKEKFVSESIENIRQATYSQTGSQKHMLYEIEHNEMERRNQVDKINHGDKKFSQNYSSIPPSDGNKNNGLSNYEDVEESVISKGKLQKIPSSEKHKHSQSNHSKQKREERRKSTSQLHSETDFGSVKQNSHIITVDKEIKKLPDTKKSNCKDIFKSSHSKEKPTKHLQTGRKIVTKFTEKDSMTGNDVIVGLQCCNQFPRINISDNQGTAMSDSKEIMDASSKDKITSLTKHAHIEKTKSKHKSSYTKEKRSSQNEPKSSDSKKLKECLQIGGKIVSKCCKEDCTSENDVIFDSQSLEHISGSSLSNGKNNQSSCFKQKDSKCSHSKQKESKSSHSNLKDSKSSHSKLKDSKSSHSKQEDSKSSRSKQKDSMSSHSKQKDSKSSHSKQEDSKSSHSKQKDSMSSHSKQEDNKSSHSNLKDSKSSHSKLKDSKSSHSKQEDNKSSHSNLKDSKSSHSKLKYSKSSHSKQEDSKSSHSKQKDSMSSHSKRKDSKSSHSKQEDSATITVDFTSTILSSTPTGISRNLPSTNDHLERSVHTSQNISEQAVTLTDSATTAVDFTSTMLSATYTGISRNVSSINDHLERLVHTSHNISEQALTTTDPATTAVDFTSTMLSATSTGSSRDVPSTNDNLERFIHTSHNVSEQTLTPTDYATPTGISSDVPSTNDHLERSVHTSQNISEQAVTLTDSATTAVDFTSTMLSATYTGISRNVSSINDHLERLVHISHNISEQALTTTDPATTAVDFTSTMLSATSTGSSRDVPSTNDNLERFIHTSHNVSEQTLTPTDYATPTGISSDVPSTNDNLERFIHTSHNVSEQTLTPTDYATPTGISSDVPSTNDNLERFIHTSQNVSEETLTLTNSATTAVDFTSSVVSSTPTKSIEVSAEELRNGDKIPLTFNSVKREPQEEVSVSSMPSEAIGGEGSSTASQKVPENIPKTFEEVYTALLQTIKMDEKELADPIRKKLKPFVLTCETYHLPPNEETAPNQKTYIPKHVSKERLNREFERLQEEKFLNYFARRGHREELFQCPFCPLTKFTVGSKTFMRSHYKLHGPTLYKCIYCADFIATHGNTLVQHVKNNHVGCVIAYYVSRELETNTEDESEECTYVFFILRDIDLDMLFGTNFKKCKNCGKDFYTNVGLYAHIIKEHYRLCCDFEFRESNDTHLCEVRQHTSSSITVSRINSCYNRCSRCFIKSVRTISGSMCGDLEVTNLHSKIHSVELYDIDTCGFLKELAKNKNIFNCFSCMFSTPFVREMEEHLRLKLQAMRSYCFRCLAFFVNDHVLQAHTSQKHFREVQPVQPQGDIMKVKEELVRKYFMFFRFAPEKFLSYLHRRSSSEPDEDDSSDEDKS